MIIKNTMIYLESGTCPKCNKHGSLFCKIERRDKGKSKDSKWIIAFLVKHVKYSHAMYLKEKVTGKRNSRMKISKYCYIRGRTQYRLNKEEKKRLLK